MGTTLAQRILVSERERDFMSERDRLWAIILAAGEGTRLAPLTKQLYGEPLPKQFAVLAGDRSLLQATIDRLLPLVPPSRMVIVVPVGFEALAREQVAKRYGAARGIHIVSQPMNKGTGPGILLPLAHVLKLDPRAQVVVTPSDHYYRDADGFISAISVALQATATVPLTLIGAEAEGAATDYGWIEEGEHLGGAVRRIHRFVEKPTQSRAHELFQRGGLWNTFVMVADGARLWRMAEERMPVQAALIRASVVADGPKGSCLARAYEQIEEQNFSRVVLENASGLGVVCARGCGFSDWGSPDRVLASLRGTREHDRLLSRLTPSRVTAPVTFPWADEMATLAAQSDLNQTLAS
jgi:mannose-1-phosphate guanylyltransferase